MPMEFKKFEAVDRIFKNNMGSIENNPYILDCIENEKMKHDFEQANEKLDTI